MTTRLYHLQLFHNSDEQTKSEVRAYARQFELVASASKEKPDMYFIYRMSSNKDHGENLSVFVTNGHIFLRRIADDNSLSGSCDFKRIKEVRSNAKNRLKDIIEQARNQIQYPSALIGAWLHEIAEINKSEFVQNKEIMDKYKRIQFRLEQAYNITASREEEEYEDKIPTMVEIRAAVFFQNNRPQVDRLNKIENKILKDFSHITFSMRDERRELYKDIKEAVEYYTINENIEDTPIEDTKSHIKSLFQGTNIDVKPYIAIAERVYMNNIRDISALDRNIADINGPIL